MTIIISVPIPRVSLARLPEPSVVEQIQNYFLVTQFLTAPLKVIFPAIRHPLMPTTWAGLGADLSFIKIVLKNY